ncbi:MAG TPA: acyltransferase [Acidobacteriaceae bacterium]|nr:acyltransferase [Acidobacteriaceae bacterium]
MDGYRALSIFLVIANHSWQEGEVRYGWHSVWGNFLDGGVGVFIFFVISGYLITKLLLNEHDRYGKFSLRRFYYRRFFRIGPPLYAYILFIAITGSLTGLHADKRELFTALTFTRNLDFHSHEFMFGHFWSLCIEEQFYLLWPIALLLALRWSGRAGATRLAVLLLVIAPVFRLATFPLVHDQPFRARIDGLLPGHMDALMFGCWACLAEGSAKFENLYQRVNNFAWLPPLWFFGISAILRVMFGNKYTLSMGYTLDGLCLVFMLLWSIRNSQTKLGRLLNWRPIAHIGVISYSVYIWQTYFLHPQNPIPLARFPWNLICILGIAELSWQTVERLSRLMRDRGERKWKWISGHQHCGQGIGASLAVSSMTQIEIDRGSSEIVRGFGSD